MKTLCWITLRMTAKHYQGQDSGCLPKTKVDKVDNIYEALDSLLSRGK